MIPPHNSNIDWSHFPVKWIIPLNNISNEVANVFPVKWLFSCKWPNMRPSLIKLAQYDRLIYYSMQQIKLKYENYKMNFFSLRSYSMVFPSYSAFVPHVPEFWV